MGSDYGSSGLVTLTASNCTADPWLQLPVDLTWELIMVRQDLWDPLRTSIPSTYIIYSCTAFLFLVVPLGVLGWSWKGPRFLVFGHCLSLPADTPCQLEIPWCYRHPLCVYHAQVRVLEQSDQICFCRLLKDIVWPLTKKQRSVLKSCAISLTNLWNSSFLIRSTEDFW